MESCGVMRRRRGGCKTRRAEDAQEFREALASLLGALTLGPGQDRDALVAKAAVEVPAGGNAADDALRLIGDQWELLGGCYDGPQDVARGPRGVGGGAVEWDSAVTNDAGPCGGSRVVVPRFLMGGDGGEKAARLPSANEPLRSASTKPGTAVDPAVHLNSGTS